MEQNRLTKKQQIIFDEVITDTFLSSQFYFTGGTALRAFYLNHRESEDLDFFSERKFDPKDILAKLTTWSQKHHFNLRLTQIETVNTFTLQFHDGEVLKVDFVFYPHKRLQKGMEINNFSIDSKTDISVNKVITIMQRSAVKDFVDLYFLLQKFSLWDLITGVERKFHIEADPFILASDFGKVKEFTYLPKMLKSLTLDQLRNFFLEKAKELAKMSVE